MSVNMMGERGVELGKLGIVLTCALHLRSEGLPERVVWQHVSFVPTGILHTLMRMLMFPHPHAGRWPRQCTAESSDACASLHLRFCKYLC